MPQYEIAARTINEERLSLAHVHTFNMDEYANEDGVTAPLSWPGSFQRAMWERFFDLVDPELRPPEEQIHFPTTEAIGDYSARIEDLGGADVCYGGIGWCGHIAFWESHLGLEFDGDLEAYKQAGARLVELHPMTIMQNALHSFGGDWSWVPPKANTIGPARDPRRAAPQLLARRRPRRRRLLAALHRAPRRARPRLRVRARARSCRRRGPTTRSSAASPTTSRSTWPERAPAAIPLATLGVPVAATTEVIPENTIRVLDHGFVRLDAFMASDLSVANGASVSFARHKELMDESDEGLIRFLMRDRHGTPFEHNAFRFHIRCPIFVAREWLRHRVGCLTGDTDVTFVNLDGTALFMRKDDRRALADVDDGRARRSCRGRRKRNEVRSGAGR